MKKPLPDNAKKVFSGIMFDIYHWEQELFDGSFTTFEKAKRNPSVQIIAIANDKIVLLEEEQPFNGKFLSLIGGGVDKGETIEDAARRELLEETGMVCEELEFLEEAEETGHIYWGSHYYIARGCKKVSDINLDGGEKIKVRLVSFEEFVDGVCDESFRNKGFSLKVLRLYYQNRLSELRELFFNPENKGKEKKKKQKSQVLKY